MTRERVWCFLWYRSIEYQCQMIVHHVCHVMSVYLHQLIHWVVGGVQWMNGKMIISIDMKILLMSKKRKWRLTHQMYVIHIDRCTLINQCSTHLWQQEKKQCTQIVQVQPLKASIDYNQWVWIEKKEIFSCKLLRFFKINLTFSKLPSLEHNEIYQCIFKDKSLHAHSQAIKLDHNRLSCPTPSHLEHSKSFE